MGMIQPQKNRANHGAVENIETWFEPRINAN
jgi:hypothetical protein